MSEEHIDYKRAAKTTFLFSAVQVVSTVCAIVKNKIIAVLLGPTGVGLISVFNTYINFVKTGACLGLSQSAVRDVSEAYEAYNKERFSRIISLTNRLVLMTSWLGILVTVIMSPFFSKWGGGNSNYVWSFVLLSLSVGFQIYSENRLAILRGMRRMRSLAWSTIIGAVAGLVISVPFYYWMGNDGIVPTLILSSFITVITTNLFVNRIQYDRIQLSFKEIFHEGKPMIQMGLALMLVNFLSGIADTITISYLRSAGGLDVVAFFGAGRTIIGSYFGVVLVAMTTDYYPRICGIYKDNVRLAEEVNAQSKLGMAMVLPLAVIFIAFASIFIPLLYSNDFMQVSQYTDYALLGTMIMIPSNCIGMVLLAKQAAKLFTTISVCINVFNILLYIAAYHWLGLTGLGIAAVVNMIVQWVVQAAVVKNKYGIFFSKECNLMLVAVLAIALVAVLVKRIDNIVLMYIIECVIMIMASILSLYWCRRMNIDILGYVKNKIGMKK